MSLADGTPTGLPPLPPGAQARGSGISMNDTGDRYKRAKSTRKTQPVKRVVLSEEARRAYEDMVKERDARDRDYVRHLASDNKPR